jgi:hypothetical protein
MLLRKPKLRERELSVDDAGAIAAESAVHKTINFLMNSYTQPTATGSDPCGV